MTTTTGHLTELHDRFFRMKFTHEADRVLEPATSPEGRFHHSGQAALYLSETPDGTIIASKRYVRPDDPARSIFALSVDARRVLDLRDRAATEHFQVNTADRTAQWQDDRAKGLPARTWTISDRVRNLGLDGMFYASRSTPSLNHLVLFRWNDADGPTVTETGERTDWAMPAVTGVPGAPPSPI